MLNFTVGPVMSCEEIRQVAYRQVPYFRTDEFSKIMLENELLLKKFFKAPDTARVLFMAGSGTASMEAAIINTLTEKDKILIVNGGSFGSRFCDICRVHELNFEQIVCEKGHTLKQSQLDEYENKGFTAFLVNLDETSTGVLYDIEMISSFCRRNNLFLIVDSISSFLCDPFDMKELGVNVVITGSQKALAIDPGLSILCVDDKALRRMESTQVRSFYFDLKSYILNGLRGQTPFTPAVGIILQLNRRLKMIEENGGVDAEIRETKFKSEYFRSGIKDLPFSVFPDKMSNAVTALTLNDKTKSAYTLFEILKNNYNIWICPNGGELKDKVFRVGHIGNITTDDYDALIAAFNDILNKNLL